MKVSVVIVNWNGKGYLETSLPFLSKQTYADYEIILVDNGSSDGSADFVSEHFPQVQVIRNDTNLGFGAANNIAIQQSSARFIATVNNDTRVSTQWLGELVRAAEETDRDVGMYASKILFHHLPYLIDSAGITVDRIGTAWNRSSGELDATDDVEPIEVFGACAAAALYRREMLNEIGLFDENLFAFYEDVDLAWRARLAGWRCLLVPTATVYHTHSGTARKDPPLKSYLMSRNKSWVTLKNYPSPQLYYCLPLMLGYDAMSIAYALLWKRDGQSAWGKIHSLAGLLNILKKRREIQNKRRVSFSELGNYMDPLESPIGVLRRHKRLQEILGLADSIESS